MSDTYDYYPSHISTRPFLKPSGQSYKTAVISNLDLAIAEIETAIAELGKVEGIGAELYTARLNKVVPALETLKGAVKTLG